MFEETTMKMYRFIAPGPENKHLPSSAVYNTIVVAKSYCLQRLEGQCPPIKQAET